MTRVLMALLLAAAPAAGEAPETVAGKVREVGGGPVGRARAVLTSDSGTEVTLLGRSDADGRELLRLSGLTVKVIGERTDRGLLVERYEIVDAGGRRPRIGVFALIDLDGKQRMLFVGDDGRAELLPDGWGKKMSRHAGAKAWMIGERSDGRLSPKRFGILRPRANEEDAK